jgi:4-hydroxyphenylpyruvate dioxygenase
MGLMGFELVEFASPTPNTLEPDFEKLGFTLLAKHRSKDYRCWQGLQKHFDPSKP